MISILLVEDNEMNRDMLSRRLTKRGYRVVTAVDGQQAVDTVSAEENLNLILMDMELPIKDGWTASREIKESTTNIPIIALTAHALAGDKEKAFSAGCDGYATKPIDFPALLEIIERYTTKEQ
jgi:CheY-like chemotaxis protein